jgi:hypothetical protein
MMTTTKLKQAETLITILKNSPDLIESFYDQDRASKLELAEKVLLHFKERQLHHFDIFHKAGFRPNENMFSDALAALLNPREGHGLGTLALEKVLDRIEAKAPRSEAGTIKARLVQNRPFISVHREKREAKSIPDIAIISRDFIIFIENKIRGGSETYRRDQWQTIRQWQVLKSQGERLSIPVLGVFLSPEGKLAMDQNFVPLSVDELVASLKDAVAVSNCPYQHSINVFLDFYTWK